MRIRCGTSDETGWDMDGTQTRTDGARQRARQRARKHYLRDALCESARVSGGRKVSGRSGNEVAQNLEERNLRPRQGGTRRWRGRWNKERDDKTGRRRDEGQGESGRRTRQKSRQETREEMRDLKTRIETGTRRGMRKNETRTDETRRNETTGTAQKQMGDGTREEK